MSPKSWRTFYKWSAVASLSVIAVFFTHCGKPSAEKGDLIWQDDKGINVSLAGTSAATSLEAFKVTVYPITRARCVSCHAASQQPFHASSDATTAHNSLFPTKINFADIPASRMVQKIKNESHNCWGNCTANAMEMQIAIQQWKDLMVDDSEETSEGTDADSFNEKTGSSQSLQAERASVYSTSMPLVLPATAANITRGTGGTMVLVNSATPYIHVPNTADNTAIAFNDAVNSAAFVFASIPTARSTGALWALVNAKAPNDDAFNIKLNAGNAVIFALTDTATKFNWQRVPGNFNFAAGVNTVRVTNRENGAQIAALLFTANQAFNPAGMGLTAGAITLKFPLADYPGASIEMRVEDYDAYSYKISQLKLTTPPTKALKIKGVYLMINGVYNAQNANLTQVDETVPMNTAKVLAPSSMVVLKDQGEAVDKFSLGFDLLEE